MRTLDNLAAMRACLPPNACAPTERVMVDMRDFIDGPVEQASFTALFGAPAYLIERVEDLRGVRSSDGGQGGRVSLADGPSEWFDIAEWIDGGRFARFITIETAEGGPQYIVPRAIADQQGSVALSIAAAMDRAA